jgi:hypothetical protein
MMAVGEHNATVDAGAALAGDMDAPRPVLESDAPDGLAAFDVVADAEMLCVLLEIACRPGMVREYRILFGEGEVFESGEILRGDHMAGLVDDAGRRAGVPKAADVVLPLEAVKRDVSFLESLGDSQPRGAGSDDAVDPVMLATLGHERDPFFILAFSLLRTIAVLLLTPVYGNGSLFNSM